MLIMGGTFPNATSCDVPSVFAFHNMDLGKDNSEGAKGALFNGNKKSKYKGKPIFGSDNFLMQLGCLLMLSSTIRTHQCDWGRVKTPYL